MLPTGALTGRRALGSPARPLAAAVLLAAGLTAFTWSAGPVAQAADTVLVPPTTSYTPNRAVTTPVAACGATVLCVGPSGSYATIGAAITAAPDGATIQVQGGTYNERITVSGKEVSLYGGFASGFGSRNPVANVTTINGSASGTTVTFNEAGDAVLDGFRIIGGKAPLDEFDEAIGSGIKVEVSGDVTISHNLVENNDDTRGFYTCGCNTEGGGLYADSYIDGSTIHVVDNVFRNNASHRGAAIFSAITAIIEGNLIEDNMGRGDHGGAIMLGGDDSVLRQNLVRGNEIGVDAGYGWGGGGIFFGQDSTTRPSILLEANRWTDNYAPSRGGGFFIDESSTGEIVGDLFHDNRCGENGAGFYIDGGAVNGSTAVLENVTISRNNDCPAGTQGTGIFAEGGSRVVVRNSIVSGNGGTSDIWQCQDCQSPAPASPSTVTYSLIGPTYGAVTSGTGTIGGAPSFVAPATGDFHLASSSPAIDTADPASTVGAEPAPNGGRRNMGAYGGTAEATPSDGGGGGTVPTAPATPTAVAGNASASIMWGAPSSFGDGTFVRWEVQRAGDVPACESTVQANRTCMATGLTNGTPYQFRVRAVTSAGNGAWSTLSTAVTPSADEPDPGDPVPGLPPPPADVWDGGCDDPATGDVFEVGPGRAYTSIGAVPWQTLGPGDRVRIHKRPASYKEKILISEQGTSTAPITVCGVADENGNRPVLDGSGATTRPGMQSDFATTQQRGLITFAAKEGDPYGTKPEFVVIEGLELTGAFPGNTFTDYAGATQTYPNNAAALYIERAETITFRDNVIRGNGNGIFAGSGDAEEALSRHILVEGNEFSGNSVPTRYNEHHSYIEAEDVVYQFNHYKDTAPGALGAALKDRSAGTVVRYNWIQGGLRALDLVEAQESCAILCNLPAYRQTWVYGNVIDMENGDATNTIHYGGDGGLTEYDTYRKGTLYFFNNTVSYRIDQADGYSGSIFDLETTDETVEAWGNAFYVASETQGQPAITMSIGRFSGTMHLGENAFSPGVTDIRYPDDWEGTITGFNAQTRPAGNNFGFTDLATDNFRPTAGSPLVNAGATPPITIPNRHTLRYEYVEHRLALGRLVNGGASDLGYYEYGPATSIGDDDPDPDPGGVTPMFTVAVPALTYGQAANVNTTVSGNGSPATGSVSLREGARTLDTATLSGGAADLLRGPRRTHAGERHPRRPVRRRRHRRCRPDVT